MDQVVGEGRGGERRGAKVLHTDRHIYRQTYRPSDEEGIGIGILE